MPKKPCARGGCPAYAVPPGRYCPRHAALPAALREAMRPRQGTSGAISGPAPTRDLASAGKGPENAAKRPRLPQSTADRIRSSPPWQRLRRWYRGRFPWCCDPLGQHRGEEVSTEHVHHVIPVAEAPHLALEVNNLRPLCARCHGLVEAYERAGDTSIRRRMPAVRQWWEGGRGERPAGE